MGCIMDKPWPPQLPVEHLPLMTQDEVELVRVAWRRVEAADHRPIEQAFHVLFQKHPDALRLFIHNRQRYSSVETSITNLLLSKGIHGHNSGGSSRHQRHPTASSSDSIGLCRKSSIEFKFKDAEISTVDPEGKVSRITQTRISQDPGTCIRSLFIDHDDHVGVGAYRSGTSSVGSYEQATGHADAGVEAGHKDVSVSVSRMGRPVHKWEPEYMFRFRIMDEHEMSEDPERDFFDSGSLSFLRGHLKRVSMVLHHVVYKLDEPAEVQKWLSCLHKGHARIPGMRPDYYECCMEAVEARVRLALGERRYSHSTRTAVRKFLVVLFGYLAGTSLRWPGSHRRLRGPALPDHEAHYDVTAPDNLLTCI